jgi:hypothetical protein
MISRGLAGGLGVLAARRSLRLGPPMPDRGSGGATAKIRGVACQPPLAFVAASALRQGVWELAFPSNVGENALGSKVLLASHNLDGGVAQLVRAAES